MFNWSKHTKHALPFSCSNTTQLKTKARKVLIDRVKARKAREACTRVLMMGKARRRVRRIKHVSMMGKARRPEGAQGA